MRNEPILSKAPDHKLFLIEHNLGSIEGRSVIEFNERHILGVAGSSNPTHTVAGAFKKEASFKTS